MKKKLLLFPLLALACMLASACGEDCNSHGGGDCPEESAIPAQYQDLENPVEATSRRLRPAA